MIRLAILLDGEPHFPGGEDCCPQFGRRCKCGGWVHWQPIYGGIGEQCDCCETEPDDWKEVEA